MKKVYADFKVRSRWLYRSVVTLAVMLLAATGSMAQGSVRVNIERRNATLPEVFEQVRRQTSLSVFYSNDDVTNVGRKDYTIQNATVDEAMKQVLTGTGLEYELSNNVIIIRQGAQTPPAAVVTMVRGKVVNESGSPMVGATVAVIGTSLGTITGGDGAFELKVPANPNPRLQISYIGYVAQQVVYQGEALNIVLQPDNTEMEAIVVTGIFERRQDTYSGATTSFDKPMIERTGNQNIIAALKNLDPTFQVLENNEWGSDPNRLPDIQMRGPSNFSDMKDKYQNSPNQPLFIVDGFEMSLTKVLDMDMNRVGSITLLKDATAKALYGSRGANGVVVIETVAPEVGRMKVTYTGDLTITAPDLSSYDLANAAEKLEIERRAGMYDSANPVNQQTLYEKYTHIHNEVLRGVDTYWLAVPLQTEFGHKHALYLEGGDETFRYGIDFSYNKRSGVMKGSDRETISGGMTFQYRYGKFTFKDQLTVTFNTANDSPYGTYSEYSRLNPYWRRYNEDGSVIQKLGDYNLTNSQGTHGIYNPLMNASLNTKLTSSYADISNNFYAEFQALEDLKLIAQFGITSQRDDNDRFYPRDHTMFANILPTDEEYFNRGRYTKSNGKMFNYDATVTANYSKVWNDKHLLFANARWSIAENKNETATMMAQGFANNKMDYITHAKAYYGTGPTGSSAHSRQVSVTGSVNYSYDSRYNFDFTYTADGSSLFGTDKRWGGFWSTGVSWNMHSEKFLKDIEWIQKLRLRASTGYSGSQNFATSQAIATYRYFNQAYSGIIGAYQMALASPYLEPQKKQDHNFGIELSLFRSLDITFDYYINNVKSMLTPVDLPPSAGFTSYTENIGETQNKGYEASINWRVISNREKDMYFSVFGKVMHNKNKLVKLSDALVSLNDERDASKGTQVPNVETDHENNKGVTKPSVLYYEGVSMSAIWAVKSHGIDPGNGQELFVKRDGTLTYKWDAADQIVAGDATPKLMGTFGFNFDWKGFTVNTVFSFNWGGQKYNQTLVDKVENADVQYNVDRRMYSDRWYEVGKPAKFKSFNSSASFTRPTSRFVQDFNEVALSSLSVGYDFRNMKWINGSNSLIERLRIQLYANDLFRISTVKTERGTEYPFARTFSLKIQATF